MLEKQNGSENKSEAVSIDKNIISRILKYNKGIDLAYNSKPEFNEEKQDFKTVTNWKSKPSYAGQELSLIHI